MTHFYQKFFFCLLAKTKMPIENKDNIQSSIFQKSLISILCWIIIFGIFHVDRGKLATNSSPVEVYRSKGLESSATDRLKFKPVLSNSSFEPLPDTFLTFEYYNDLFNNTRSEDTTLTCDTLKSDRNYRTKPSSELEANYPLAFSIVIHKDFQMFEKLLRAIYQPQNIYCVRKSYLDILA